jgi:hypothetical protein
MPILDIQRRGIPIGRIRLGQKVLVRGKVTPVKLGTFRLTSPSEDAIREAAEKLGGDPRPWERQWEVLTPLAKLYVLIPPRDAIVSQWYEMWNKGGCLRRCDSQRERISGGECLCPHAADPGNADEVAAMALQRHELAKRGSACKIATRISLMIPDLSGIGVWRLDTGSFYAAGEVGDIAATLEVARSQNLFLPATATIQQRVRVADGRATTYPVPVLQALNTFREIASGQLGARGIDGQMPPALGAGPRVIAAAASGPPATPSGPAEPAPAPFPDEPPPDDDDLAEPCQQARELAGRALATTSSAALRACFAEAEARHLRDEHVCIDRERDEWQDLRSFLDALWATRAAAARAASVA